MRYLAHCADKNAHPSGRAVTSPSCVPRLSIAVVMFVGLWTPAGRAGFVVSAPSNIRVAPGGMGSFDVTVSDTDPAGGKAYLVTSFQLELRVAPASGITFLDATTSTSSPYLFFGNSADADPAFGLPFITPGSTPTDLMVSDTVDLPGSATTISPGQTFGLVHVSFAAAFGSPLGQVAIQIVRFDNSSEPNGTLFGDENSLAIATTLANGQIVVAPNSVPEPSSLLLCLCGAGIIAACGASGGHRVLGTDGSRPSGQV